MKDLTKLHPTDYLKIVYRRKWYVVGVFLLIAIGSAVYAWRKPDVYRSLSRIQVETTPVPQDYVRPSDRSTPQEQIAAIRDAVQSRSFIERMIQDFQLFGYGMADDFSMEGAVRAIRGNIEITTSSPNTFNVAFHASNPQLAQSFTRRMVETLIQSSTSSRRNRAIETDQFLDEQLRQINEKLAAQEERIKEFKLMHMGRLPQQSAANLSALSDLNAQLERVENALQRAKDQGRMLDFRNQEQRRLNAMTQGMLSPNTYGASSPGAREGGPGPNSLLVSKQEELNALSLKYTSTHPDVVRLSKEVDALKRQLEASAATVLPDAAVSEPPEEMPNVRSGPDIMLDVAAAEIRLEAEAVKSEIAKYERDRVNILSQIRTYQGRLNLAPELEQEYMGLEREYDSIRQQYATLQNKKFQSQMTANLEAGISGDVYKIIDEASLPERPIFPNRMQIIGIGLLAGLAAGIGAAVGRELLDTTLASEEEVTALLKLPVLATISEVPDKQLSQPGRSGRMLKSA